MPSLNGFKCTNYEFWRMSWQTNAAIRFNRIWIVFIIWSKYITDRFSGAKCAVMKFGQMCMILWQKDWENKWFYKLFGCFASFECSAVIWNYFPSEFEFHKLFSELFLRRECTAHSSHFKEVTQKPALYFSGDHRQRLKRTSKE